MNYRTLTEKKKILRAIITGANNGVSVRKSCDAFGLPQSSAVNYLRAITGTSSFIEVSKTPKLLEKLNDGDETDSTEVVLHTKTPHDWSDEDKTTDETTPLMDGKVMVLITNTSLLPSVLRGLGL